MKETKKSHGPSFHRNPEQLTSTPTKQDLINEEIQMLPVETHLEVQQREDIRRDLSEGRKFVPPDLRVGEQGFYWQEDPSKIQQGRKSGKWLKVEIIAVKGSMVVINTGASIFHVNASKLRRFLDTLDLEEQLRVSEQEHLCCGYLVKGRTEFWDLFADNSYLSAILDRHGLLVTAPINLRKKKAESFSPQALQGFRSEITRKSLKIVGMSPTALTKYINKKQYRLCFAIAENRILGGKNFPYFSSGIKKIWWLKKVQYLQKISLPIDPPAWQETHVDFSYSWRHLTTT